MTTYQLSIGYNACRTDREEQFESLLREAEYLKDNPLTLIAEVGRVEPEWTSEELEPFVDSDTLKDPDNRWLTVKRIGEPDIESSHITLWASTNDGLKYAVRRAMVRLLMTAMHREGIELCVYVG